MARWRRCDSGIKMAQENTKSGADIEIHTGMKQIL